MRSGYANMKCGLIGEKLGHSFSAMIHGLLADYSYDLIELAPDQVERFMKSNSLDAFNVTIPYKKTVMPYLDVISPEAEAIGAVNTVVREKDGRLYGYNTDYFGFSYTLDSSGIEVKDKKVIVFGAGGASATACAVLRDRGVRELAVISSKDNTPKNLEKYSDFQLIVNTSPVGMYPKNGKTPVDISAFPQCQGVVDVIYNPSLTRLLLDAEEMGLPHVNGLPMLVAQAVKAFELFTGDRAEADACRSVISKIQADTKNIILIGMPGCGKSSVGRLLAQMLNRSFYDADDVFKETFGRTPAEVITAEGENVFRAMEHTVCEDLGKLSGAVISCGGGVVTREYNYPSLHQNGTVIFLQRELSRLSKKGRPISQSTSVEELYAQRRAAYERFADITVQSTEVQKNTALLMLKELGLERSSDI